MGTAMPAPALATSDLVRAAAASVAPVTTEVATTLPVAARTGFELFADVAEIPRWLSVVQAAHVLERDPAGRAVRVSFRAALERASLGYVLDYQYQADQLRVRWSSAPGRTIRVEGEASFVELSPRACLMSYRLSLELPVSSEWLTRHYDNHAASAVVGHFREYVRRHA